MAAGICLNEDFVYATSLATKNTPWIRLVEIPAELKSDGSLDCKLLECEFDNTCPEYQALSYVWGVGVPLRTISLSGKRFQVTETLLDALHGLHSADETQFYWIDQITINQQDNIEKTQQVSMMREIYSRASHTVAWLSNPSAKTDKAIAALLRASQMFTNENKVKIWPAMMSVFATSNSKLDWGESKPSYSEYNAISSLLARPWFRRMWIVQEACVSQSLTVQCGQAKIDFDLLLLGAFLVILVFASTRLTPRIPNIREISFLASIRFASEASSHTSLIEMMMATRRFGATDIRDRLYALYGITSTKLETFGLRPDYTTDARTAYIEATFALTLDAKNLNLLELVEGRESNELQFPSWVPTPNGPYSYDWSIGVPEEASRFLQSNLMKTMLKTMIGADVNDETFQQVMIDQGDEESLQELRNLVKLPADEDIDAGRGRIPYLAQSRIEHIELDESGSLTLQGQIIDKIHEASEAVIWPAIAEGGAFESRMEAIDNDASFRTVFKEVTAGLLDIFREFSGFARALLARDNMVMKRGKEYQYPTGKPLLVAYREIVCIGDKFSLTDEQLAKGFNQVRDTFKSARGIDWMRQKISSERSSGLMTLISWVLGAQVSGQSEEAKTMFSAMVASYDRKLVWTEKGYLALVPAAAEVGDLITLLRGGRLPFVLRPQKGPWRLLGSAFIHGVDDSMLNDVDSLGTIKIA